MTRPPNPDLPEQILDEAERITIQQGHEALNMRSLARKVGVTPTAIYHYFENKEVLLYRLKLRVAERLNDRIRKLDPSISAHEALHAIGRAYIEFAEGNPRLYKLLLEELIQNTDLEARDRTVLYHTYYAARNALERLADSGELPHEPKYSAMMGWTMLHGFSSLLISGRLEAAEGMDREALKSIFFRFYAGGQPAKE